MRDLMILGVFLALIPLAFRNTYLAFLVWAWTTVLAVDSYTFGFMQSVRLNFVFSLLACTLILLGHDKGKKPFTMSRGVLILGLFLLQATISNLAAFSDNTYSSEIYSRLVKALLFCFLMPMVLTSRYRIHCFVIVLALGLGFHGIVEGLKVIASGGAHHVQGLAKYGDNNQFALAMVIIVPLLLWLYKALAHKWAQRAALLTFVLTLVCIVGTYSRGAFIGLVAIALWSLVTAKRKMLAGLLIAICAGFVVLIAPDAWSDRMGTIQEADADSSFLTRIVAWKVSSAIALDRPFIGGGLRAVVIPTIWNKYKDSDGLLPFVETSYRPDKSFVAHSIYFEVLGDLGFVGFFLFLALFANAFFTWIEIRRMVKKGGGEKAWAGSLANALMASTFAYLVAGAALSMAYFEIIYMLLMLLEILKRDVQASPVAVFVPQAYSR